MRLSRIAGVAVLVAVFTGAAAPARAQAPSLVITGINLTNVVFDATTGVVTATGTITGTLAGHTFTTPISISLSPGQGTSCSVLDLEISPIHISLLGLHVDTSSICLTITASNQGLGSLLCGLVSNIAGALGDLTTITNLLNTALNDASFLSGLTDILNQALGQAQNAPPGHGNGHGHGGASVCTGQCPVLDVFVGPLTLNLLGLTVKLNNCNNGAVEVCVSATRSEGLLGQLLCGLAGHGGLSGVTLQEFLAFIENLLSSLNLP